jgi:hypothetical protein
MGPAATPAGVAFNPAARASANTIG